MDRAEAKKRLIAQGLTPDGVTAVTLQTQLAWANQVGRRDIVKAVEPQFELMGHALGWGEFDQSAANEVN